MSIRIVRSGLQVTVQDLGRYGCQDLGVPVGGSMDDWSARLANLLVGKPRSSGRQASTSAAASQNASAACVAATRLASSGPVA